VDGSGFPEPLSPHQVHDLNSTKPRGLPPFTIRNTTQINKDLGDKAIADGFVPLIVLNQIKEPSWSNDLGR